MKSHDDEFQRQVAEATRRGEEQLRTQPWAVSVKFDLVQSFSVDLR